MNARSTAFAALVFVLPVATGCVSRAAPFNSLDDSTLTVVKLSADTQQSPLGTPFGTMPFPTLPGMTPEQMQQMQQQFQQGVQQFGQMTGLPVGQIPGMTPAPQQQRLNGFLVTSSVPGEESLKQEMLDLLGDEESFNGNAPANCFTPGMAFIFTPADGSPNLEVMISHSCNQLRGNGFDWPYQVAGFTPETANKLANVYNRLWGARPGPGT